MQNRYPMWKNLLVLCTLVLGMVYSAPNLYHPDAAIQITGDSGSTEMNQTVVDQAVAALDADKIEVKATEFTKGAALIRLNHRDQQLNGKAVVEKALGSGFVVALNLAPTTPVWLNKLGAAPMKLGLDLAGGVHFLLEVDTSAVLSKRLGSYVAELKTDLVAANLENRQWTVKVDGQHLVIKFPDLAALQAAMPTVKKTLAGFQFRMPDAESPEQKIIVTMPDTLVREVEDYAVTQNVVSLRNRVNELGVAEPLVQKQGRNRIVVELPGVQDAAQAKRIIGKTANLEFRLVATAETPTYQRERFSFRNQSEQHAELIDSVIVTGDQVTSAQASFDSETNLPQVNISLDGKGGQKMNLATRNNVGKQMGVLFIETKSEMKKKRKEDGTEELQRVSRIERGLINVATIQSALGVQFRITGLDNMAEANELALLLRAGALAAPVYFIEESTIGPSLGAENISRGFQSTMWGFVAIAVFMIIYYRVFGVVSVLALASNLMLLIALLAVLQATLTLPGIAAIALTLGMAIDANVLINERIREELRGGAGAQQAILTGYERAFGTILDSNVTTFIAGLMLLIFGTGPVRGFAVVHCLGILTSIFSSIVISRAFVNFIYGRPEVRQLSIGQIWKPTPSTAVPAGAVSQSR